MIFPDEARRLAALACDGAEIDPAIFARDAQGKTLSGTHPGSGGEADIGIAPRIVFDGGRGFIRIYGLGREGAGLLLGQAPGLFAALYKAGFRGFEQKDGEMALAWKDDGAVPLYAIRCLVVAKKPAQCQRYIKAPLVGGVAQSVGEVIVRGLSGVARMLDEELLQAGLRPKHLASVPSHIDILEGTPIPVMVQPGIIAAAYRHVLFHLPCKLNGPWATGMLRSRGYGLIRPVNPARGA